MADDAGVRVEGVRELLTALRKAERADLRKQLGQANREIGAEVIRRLQPLPDSVGLGAGATVRPSANARLVQLKAGGAHRNTGAPVAQWGRRHAPRDTPRPHIVGTALRVFPRIENTYLEAIDRIVSEVSGT